MKNLAFYYLNKYSVILSIAFGFAFFLLLLTADLNQIHGRRSGIFLWFVRILGLELAALISAAILGGIIYLILSELPVNKDQINGSKKRLIPEHMQPKDLEIFDKVKPKTLVIVGLLVIVIVLMLIGIDILIDVRSDINKKPSPWGEGFGGGF